MTPHRRVRYATLAVVLLLLPLDALAAQDAPYRRVIVISDFAAIAWINPPPDRWVPVTGEMGALVRISDTWGLGWTVTGDITREVAMVATGPRVRRWLTPRVSLGVGAGLSVAGHEPLDVAIVTANIRYADLVGAIARFDVEPDGIGWGLGLQLGSVPGFGATILSAVAFGAYVIFWSGFEGDL